ncbi:MAG: AraC family transcriptional regulator [Clostridia bacterium]|nr:AraC family transcriptional regulator [Clostridia bacterium]
MQSFVKVGDLQHVLKEHYQKTGDRLQFHEAIDRLDHQGLVLHSLSRNPRYTDFFRHWSQEDFEDFSNELYIPVLQYSKNDGQQVQEGSIFPLTRDVFIFRHPRYTRLLLHTHDFVEIDFVVKGSFRLHFEDTVHEFREGTVCLIAPGSRHDVEISDESTVYTFMLRRSTFEATFFSLLSRDDTLSLFFRNILQQKQEPNYLMFHIGDTGFSRGLTERAMLECFTIDDYANICAVSMIHLIFAEFLREAGDSPQFYHYHMGKNFSAVLNYIRHHYQTVTLTQLSEQFHYSKPHLCALIKQNTGVSFSDLIRQIRMSRARDYLLNTDLPVTDIADIVGYNSSDHFSRVFRSTFDCSPREYRRTNAKSDEHFVPFEMN